MEEIGKILPKVLKLQLSRLEPPVVEILAPLWSLVVGKALAKECRPVAFSAGTLRLATEDPDWAEPLQQMAEEIRLNVNNFLGKPVVRDLRVLGSSRLTHRGGGQQLSENLSVSDSRPRGWLRKGPGVSPTPRVVIDRPHVKCSSRKPEGVQ